MSDFSLFSLFTAGLACMVPFATAYTKPVGDSPSGNPIAQPGLNSVVPAGKPFTITWQPTTSGTVTLVLLKGPSSNAEPQYAIVEKTPNDGTYVWTPSTDLAPTDNAQGYGIQLIDDANGQYQYTTQFGISNADYNAPASSSSSSSTSSTTKSAPAYYPTTTSAPHYTTAFYTHYTTYCPSATTLSLANHTYTITKPTTLTISDCSCTLTKPLTSTSAASAAPFKPTGYSTLTGPAHNITMVAPTGWQPSSTIKTTLASSYSAPSASASSSSSGPDVSTGGSAKTASSVIGLVLAAGVAVFAI